MFVDYTSNTLITTIGQILDLSFPSLTEDIIFDRDPEVFPLRGSTFIDQRSTVILDQVSSNQNQQASPLSVGSVGNERVSTTSNPNFTDLYYFTYHYGNGDFYIGYGSAEPTTYWGGQIINPYEDINITGNDSYYFIDSVYSGYAGVSGQVEVYSYYDSESFAYADFTFGSGFSGLGTEFGYAYNASYSYTESFFGYDYYQADLDNNTFTTFSVVDASGDNTLETVFQGGGLCFSYDLADAACVASVELEVLSEGNVVSSLGTWSSGSLANTLINLADLSLTGGNYQVRAVAQSSTGSSLYSTPQTLTILPWDESIGTFAGETFNYSALSGTGAVIWGRGGTDTLYLSQVEPSSITSINGVSLIEFNSESNSTVNQAIFQGTSFDYLTLENGQEIYFQGIENLKFSDGTTLDLTLRPNDPFFSSQWNLHVSDVSSAWRFTQGSSDVILASLDTGILSGTDENYGIVDIEASRLLIDTSKDNTANSGHGHKSISVMAGSANNELGVAGINWNSKVLVHDIYAGVSLQKAIEDTIEYARTNNLRVVFQSGIQGDYWLSSGGTQAELEQLIQENSDITLFAIAAGNGGPAGNLDDPNYLDSVSGVAQLETTHENVMSVGALQPQSTKIIDSLINASAVNIASYSNRGSNLTLMAATDSPAMDNQGNKVSFGGTSSSNPNLAGIASLVWSVNPTLTGGEVRQILIDTAMDLGAEGRDNTFGYGLVDADAAIRRAWALATDVDLANLYPSDALVG